MKRNIILKMFLFCVFMTGIVVGRAEKVIELKSPDGRLKATLNLSDKIYYSVWCDAENIFKDNYLQLDFGNEKLGQQPKLIHMKRTKVNQNFKPVIPFKFSTVKDQYNQLILDFKGDYAVEFRAYDDGIAYRFVTNKKGDVEVTGEQLALNFPDNYLLHMQQPGGFKTAYEEPYQHIESKDWKATDRMAVLPLLIDTRKQCKVLVSESDLSDYPCMFLKGNDKNGVVATFPKVPLEFGEDGDRSLKILKEADYIAKTSGKRNFPWRYMVIARDDRQIIENTMTYRLASKNVLNETDWIKPGQASWEWWNGATPYGPDVNFVSGYNLATYKYFIDFAAKSGIPYIIMDEGWAKSTRDPYTPNPNVDVHELIRYGKEKNVGIVLWLTWLTVENNMGLFKTFADWGVKGVKIDFMDRSDQWMVNYYERVAKEAAKHHILVDYHGAFKPAGIECKYPNILSYEGVRGLEQMNGCHPDNTIYLPFMRNAVGPMDFTPGAMINMQPNVYRSERPNSASMGTRTYQMALFVLFESGLQMLCDNPTLYYKNPECTEFITQVPVTWDETRALVAEAGEVIVVAKRKGEKWYIGGITNGRGRELEIRLDFLGKGKSYKMVSFEDGINAGYQGMDYRRKETTVKPGDVIQVKMVQNGGWAARIE